MVAPPLGTFDCPGLLGSLKAEPAAARRCLLAALARSLDPASGGLGRDGVPPVGAEREKRGKNRQARYQSAAASAREALACFETAEALGWVEPLPSELASLFHRIIGTLVRLIEPKR